MVPERDFVINFKYFQWAIIPMIDGTINNFKAFDFGHGNIIWPSSADLVK